MLRKTTFAPAVLIIAILFASTPSFSQDFAAEISKGKEALSRGDYRGARDIFKPLLTTVNGPEREEVMGYFDTFLHLGEYARGIQEVNSYLQDAPEDPYLLNAKGKLLIENGNYPEAEQAFSASRIQKNDFWPNLMDTARLYELTGRSRDARRIYRLAYTQYKNQRFRTSRLLGLAGVAAAKVGEFHDANSALRTAYQIDKKNIDVLYWWGELFREKYNNADAVRTYEEALATNPNRSDLYVGLGKAAQSFVAKEQYARTALKSNPNDVEAMGLLAETMILDQKFSEVEELMNNALLVNPSSTTALAHLASVHFLRGDTAKFKQIELQATDINDENSRFYSIVADNLVIKFRYKDAVDISFKGLSRNRGDAQAMATLGTNLLRIGKSNEAYSYLKMGFDRDPFNLFAGNSLNLLDEYENFDTFQSENFDLIIHKDESTVLASTILKYAQESLDSLSLRYPYKPDGRIKIEAYNDKDDFAVRLSGLPGAPLLGVCFGDIFAFTTPEAQQDQKYNWARTLWHEMGHVMALGLSDHRVPRWFTEGLSVYEELKARPQWGREMDLELFSAYDQKLLLPIDSFNEGFTRPKYPLQIILSYYQASKIIEIIERDFGFNAIADLLVSFGQGKDVETSFQEVLGTSTRDIDKRFFDSLDERMSEMRPLLRGLPNLLGTETGNMTESIFEKITGGGTNPFTDKLKSGYTKISEGDLDGAEEDLNQARLIFPKFIQNGNPYQGLAEVYRQKNNEEALVAILKEYLTVTEYGAGAARELAEIFEKNGNIQEAAYYLKLSIETEPYEIDTHTRLAELYETTEDYAKAVDERKIILALNPLDKAKAFYQLAYSMTKNKDFDNAKREVLKSLELAPTYRDAQKLLLEIIANKKVDGQN